MAEWKKCKISDIGTVVGGATPSTKKSENYENGDISWITPKDLSTFCGRYIKQGERNITETGYRSCSTQLLPRNSVLFSSRAPIGYVAIAAKELCTNQGFKSVIPNENIDPLFLYYLLKYNKHNIESMGSGTTFKEVSANTMRNIIVFVPSDKRVQEKIASILGALDNKIEENERINNNLELQAQAIFSNEFLTLETLPDSWKQASLIDIADYLNGLAMQKYRPTVDETGIPVLKIKELRQGCCDDNSELCSPNIKSEYIIRDGDVIFSWSGSLLVDFWCGGICGLNQHLFKVTSNKYDKWFYYAWTKHHLDRFIAVAADKATTMGHIKRDELSKAEVLIPNEADYKRIGDLLQPIYDLIIANRIENKKLAEARDTLLPKLMSGEIDISEVDYE
ncbi:restriction endonuclease subunit S [Clostridium sp. AF37-5]|uniref:restriction endonuclease subunit S n=1 Tax=Clostridium sp. AF37-5 TaxID=2293016 RepID=UPI000E4C8E34|nr:restriction endonuclease subunit S [Clostridium sp. AF37-5]RHO98153.1 restriction endonuclease subunit S [Clostridium sp. AF37-5]